MPTLSVNSFSKEGYVSRSLYDQVMKELNNSQVRIKTLEEENQRLRDKILKLGAAELDRFWKETPFWELYERFVGHFLEEKGYQVSYFGIKNKGKGDDGIDLLCKKNEDVLLVQCKSQVAKTSKAAIMAFNGALSFYRTKNLKEGENLRGEVYSKTEFSKDAKECANALGIKIHVRIMPFDFEVVKCKKVLQGYYLPTDDDYDEVGFSLSEGDYYMKTVEEAEKAGFHRKIL